ncbi:MAG: FG-GAP-like repeat-containing protein [Bacteroidota bacterium]
MIYSAEVDIYHYELADFDGDGHPDLLFTEAFSSVTLYFNSGDLAETNWAAYHFPGGWDTVIFHVGDYDNDGDLDVTLRNTQQAEPTAGVNMYRNDGDRTFSYFGGLQRTFGSGFHHTQFDFDQDGVNEIMFPESLQWWQWYTLADELILHTNALPNLINLAALDIDQDGFEDLVWKDGNEIFWARFLGNRIFSNTFYFILDNASTAPDASPQFADLNGDGPEDLIVKLNDGQLVWFPGEPSNGSLLVECYYDENDNGTRDAGEPGVQGLPVDFNDGAVTYFTDALGQVSYFELLGEGIDLRLGTADCWYPINGITDYNLSIPPGQYDTLKIGLGRSDNDTAASITSFTEHSTTRCFWPVAFSLLHHNSSCQIESGVLALRLDSTTTLLETAIPPDLIEDNVLWWSFENQLPGETRQFGLTLEMPNEQLTGAALHFDWFYFSADCEGVIGEDVPSSTLSQGLRLCDSDNYEPVVRCSYDPNDKQVQPLRDSLRNYTLFEEALTYTIRFQNTGNDTAFDVHIRDFLDPALDWRSLQTIGASHEYELRLNWETGEIDYYFKDILLPDSTTNEPASHGFVQYRISAQDSLPENTIITNEARIYFDFNPPIITNNVHNEMVSALPEVRVPEALFETSVNNLKVQMQDGSRFEPTSWQWNFGDGTGSHIPYPQHTYAAAGTYDVCLTVANTQGADQLCRSLTVEEGAESEIEFTDGVTVYTASNTTFLVDAADMNGDGLSDAVVANIGDSLLLLLNDGVGALAPPQLLATINEEVTDIKLGDLDQDGDQDVVVALEGGSVQWLMNQGDGSWSAPTEVAAYSSPGVLRAIALTDINRDGQLDIVVGWARNLAWVENLGTGTFTAPHLISNVVNAISAIATADLDRDNDTDLVIRGRLQGVDLILRFDQQYGTFKLQDFSRQPDGFSPARIEIVDYNQDSYADLFHGVAFSGSIYFTFLTLVNNLQGSFSASNGLGSFQTEFANDFHLLDLDTDGDEDLVRLDYLDLECRRNNAGAFSTIYTNLAQSDLSDGKRKILPFLLDYDEDLDILLKEGEQLRILENVTIFPPPLANFTHSVTDSVHYFTDRSNYGPTEWHWTFGDGGESTDQNPTHVYADAANYQVCLTATNAVGSTTFCYDHQTGGSPEPCFAPNGLTVSEVSQTGARISWQQPGGQTEYWEIEIVTAGSMLTGNPTYSNLSTPEYLWNEASSNTAYHVYVRRVCTDGFSAWTGPVSLVTPVTCGDAFYDPAGPDDDYPAGMEEYQTICPDSPDEQVQLEFTQVDIAPGDQLQLVAGTSFPTDNEEYLEFDLREPGVYTSNYADGCVTIFFQSQADSPGASGWSAAINCVPTPVCEAPSAFTAEDIPMVEDGVELRWYAMHNIYPLQLEVVPHNDLPTGVETITEITTMPYQWLADEVGQVYDFYLRGHCTDGNFTEWIGPVTTATVRTDDLPGTVRHLSLSPNPTTGDVQLAADLWEAMEVQLEITDLYGRTLWLSHPQYTASVSRTLDMRHYPAGTYLLRVRAGHQWITRPVVKLE